jgi:uncharacterized sulfatase
MFGIDENGKHHSEWAFTDIDEAPTKSYIVENREDELVATFFNWSVGKRPEFELFDVNSDPFCLNNLSGNSKYSEVENEMRKVLMEELKKSKDPRVAGPDKAVFDSYIRYSKMREFPDPKEADYKNK